MNENGSPQFEKTLYDLSRRLKSQAKILAQAADIIALEGVSRYPIFVIHQESLELGIPLSEFVSGGNLWGIKASTLEEMVAKKLIAPENVEKFKSA